MYKRINRNSLAQFMRTRIRYAYISAPLRIVSDGPLARAVVVRPGVTFKYPSPKKHVRVGQLRRENLRRIRALRAA